MTPALTAILYAPGTNCHEETAAAMGRAGVASELVLLRDLLDGRSRLTNYQAVVIPGGFSYGDHLGAGRIFATLLVARLGEQLQEFLAAGKPVLGICNGFQVLAEAGILPLRSLGKRGMALLENQSGRFEDRKVRLLVSRQECVWTHGLGGEILKMPSAHGEGRPLFPDSPGSGKPRVALNYADAKGDPTCHYPENPNGAPDAVAGITDESGLVLGLMPHPERASLPAHYSQDGLKLFKNLARHLSS
ncbi:MAG TPA: phosphoribosylformylglycinamidine synthase I [Terriglobia bacterium]|nr:phosphoribosylformylglycinamidine synthase I [Terriglobia bacterium]